MKRAVVIAGATIAGVILALLIAQHGGGVGGGAFPFPRM